MSTSTLAAAAQARQPSINAAAAAAVLLAELALLALLAGIYHCFQIYDWDQPFTKFLCYGALFGTVALLARAERPARQQRWLARAEVATLATLLLLVVGWRASDYARHVFKRAKVDVGTTTQQAASVFFREHRNPYGNVHVSVRPDIAEGFPGFHYGPVMFLGYAPSAFWPALGLKLTSAVYLVGTLVALALALWNREGPTRLDRLGAVLFFGVAALLPERLWHELFRQGAIDILPVFLLALAVHAAQGDRWFAVGLFSGLSLATKFSPALFLLIVLVRRRIRRDLLLGLLVGSLPLVAFFVWSPKLAWEGIILVLSAASYDSTSLYSITPPPLHFVFPVVLLVSAVVVVCRSFSEPPRLVPVVRDFVLLLFVAELCYKEIHANHLIWMLPFLAWLLAWMRRSILPAAVRALSLDEPARGPREPRAADLTPAASSR